MNLIIVSAILLLTGLGYANVLVRRMPGYSLALALSIAPVLGAAILIIEGGVLATGKVSLHQVQGLAVATFLISLIFSRSLMPGFSGFTDWLRAVSWQQWAKWATFVLILIVVASRLNPFHHGFLYCRLGVDLAAYASATSEILNIPSNLIFSNEILHVAHRWGLPSLSALLYSTVPWQLSIYEILFGVVFTMFVSAALSMGFVFSQVLSEHYRRFENESANKNIALVIALVIVVNSAQLNFINEGFYPQIMSTAMLGLVLVIFMFLRNKYVNEIGYLENKNLREKIQITLLLAILFGAIAITYSEALVLGIAFIVGIFLLDLIVFDTYRMQCDLWVAAGIFLGLLLAFSVTKDLISFTFNNSNNIGGIGYSQPSWLFPSELMGVGSIYANIAQYLDTEVAVHSVVRTNIGLIIGSCASLIVAYVIYRGALFLRDLNFLLTAVFGIIAFFVINYWLSRGGYMPESYAYNKLSSILSVVLIGLAVVGIRYMVG